MIANPPQSITITHEGVKVIGTIDLVPNNDPILHEVMPQFDFNYEDPMKIANLLIEALQKYGGLGIAAPQIGQRKNCFVAGVGDNIVAYFNPSITYIDDIMEIKEEGCLTYPGLFVKIRRHSHIHMVYQDYVGAIHTNTFAGMTARILQHETDHLNGITIKESAGKFALQLAIKKMKKRKK